MNRLDSAWWVRPLPKPQANVRLFCFPYAGRGASAFHKWGNILGDSVEVWSLQLPGRESRFRESPLTSLAEIVTNLSAVLPAYLDRPFAFFGHSMGALVAYETARMLQSRSLLEPICLLLSGHRAASIPPRHPPLHILHDADFIERLAALGGIPKELVENREIMSLFLPVMRADMTVCERYTWEAGANLHCPIAAYGGLTDERAALEDVRDWRTLTEGEFAMHHFPGNHFFLHSAESAVLDRVARDLRRFGNLAVRKPESLA